MISQYLSYLQESTYPHRLFHLNQSNKERIIITPKIPDNFMTKQGYENNIIPRVSVSPDIKYNILAIGYNKINDNKNKIYDVYEPNNYNKLKILHNSDIIKRNLVSDAKQTKEIWILNKTLFKRIGKIKITNLSNQYRIIKFGNESRRSYFWNYKILSGNI